MITEVSGSGNPETKDSKKTTKNSPNLLSTNTNIKVATPRRRQYCGGKDWRYLKRTELFILDTLLENGGSRTVDELHEALHSTGQRFLYPFLPLAIRNLSHRGNNHIPKILSILIRGKRLYFISPDCEVDTSSHHTSPFAKVISCQVPCCEYARGQP
jgi:hypothetical protein